MLSDSGINQPDWMRYLDEMRGYRDKFIAHLDDVPTMNIPQMSIAAAATFYLYDTIRAEDGANALQGLPTNLRTYAQRCLAQAKTLYEEATRWL
jgi:hypothetical protein